MSMRGINIKNDPLSMEKDFDCNAVKLGTNAWQLTIADRKLTTGNQQWTTDN